MENFNSIFFNVLVQPKSAEEVNSEDEVEDDKDGSVPPEEAITESEIAEEAGNYHLPQLHIMKLNTSELNIHTFTL